MPASTAVIVLGNETLRWSAPTEFNDPYDVPSELAFDISSAELQEEISAYMTRAVQEPNEEIGHFLPDLQYIIEAARRATPDTRAEILCGNVGSPIKPSPLSKFQVDLLYLIGY